MDSIKGYLDKRFSRMPDTPQVQRAKQELGQMMEDKYSELIHEGKSHEDAMNQVIAEFGNLDELAQDLGIEGDMPEEAQSMSGRDYDQPWQDGGQSSRDYGQSGQTYGQPGQESSQSGQDYGRPGQGDGTSPYGTTQTFTPPKKDSTAGRTALIVILSVLGGIVLVGLIIAGLVIGGIWGFFKTVINYDNFDTDRIVIGEMEQVTDSVPLDFFTEADFDLAVANLVIEVGDEYRIRYDGAKNLEPEYKVEQGKLTVRQPDAGNVSLFQNRKGIDITITIPEDAQIKDFKVDLDLGNIEWGGAPISAAVVDITADLGNVKFSDCGMDRGIFQCSAGNVELKNCSAGSLTVECNLGDMSITDCLGQKVDVECDMGNVSMENVAFDDYEVSCDMGKVEISSVFDLKDYKIDISTDLGGVEVNGKSQGMKFSQNGTKGTMEVDADMGSVVLKYSDIPKKE